MKYELTQLIGYRICATDGVAGRIRDFYLEGNRWKLAYVLINTSRWRPWRRMFIPVAALTAPDPDARTFQVPLTRQQVRESAATRRQNVMSRQRKAQLRAYRESGIVPDLEHPAQESVDRRLRSARALTGYRVQATDGAIGCVADFVVEGDTWNIGYIVVRIRGRLPRKSVLIHPYRITKVSTGEAAMFVDLPREAIRNSPRLKLVDAETIPAASATPGTGQRMSLESESRQEGNRLKVA
jgi:hypothetical protein